MDVDQNQNSCGLCGTTKNEFVSTCLVETNGRPPITPLGRRYDDDDEEDFALKEIQALLMPLSTGNESENCGLW